MDNLAAAVPIGLLGLLLLVQVVKAMLCIPAYSSIVLSPFVDYYLSGIVYIFPSWVFCNLETSDFALLGPFYTHLLH